MQSNGIIAGITPGSIAAELGLQPGDKVVKVNDNYIRDIIELKFALADEFITMLIEKQSGIQELYEIEKDYDEDLGIEWESAVWDGIKCCANNCIFCFVDQMPPGMRDSLYVKDDDYRMSYLYGNFITLTNLDAIDFEQIRTYHLSPLYVSVHTTNGELRKYMMNNPFADNILTHIKKLAGFGISMHFQIVLCPDINDGKELENTIADLAALGSQALSIAVVPVGLTDYRQGLYDMGRFDKDSALQVITQANCWQQKFRQQRGSTFLYIADEFYMLAGKQVPSADWYDGFPQLENGIGLVRSFIDEWQANLVPTATGYDKPLVLAIICGISAEKVLRPLIDELSIPNLTVHLIAAKNHFFGQYITVTGLLTGQDIIANIREANLCLDGLIVPGPAMRKESGIFLDDMSLADLSSELALPIHMADFAKETLQLLYKWK